MTEADLVVDIDRIVLSDLTLPPSQAYRIRALVREELQRRLEQQEWTPGSLHSSGKATADTAPLSLKEGASERELARSLAERILRVLRGEG